VRRGRRDRTVALDGASGEDAIVRAPCRGSGRVPRDVHASAGLGDRRDGAGAFRRCAARGHDERRAGRLGRALSAFRHAPVPLPAVRPPLPASAWGGSGPELVRRGAERQGARDGDVDRPLRSLTSTREPRSQARERRRPAQPGELTFASQRPPRPCPVLHRARRVPRLPIDGHRLSRRRRSRRAARA